LGVRPPAEAEIYAPEFPAGLDWLNVAFLRMNTLMGRGAVLVEFWDFARINSLRTLPYLKEWHARYADAGLRVIGVHTPGYSFGRDRDTVARAVERLEIEYPVLLDPDYETWRLYGNKGWPGRYLFDRTGKLAHIHYGEGEYEDTERAIGECLELEVEPRTSLCRPIASGSSWCATGPTARTGSPRRTRAPPPASATPQAAHSRRCPAATSSRGSTRSRVGPSRPSRRASGSTESSSRLRRRGDAQDPAASATLRLRTADLKSPPPG
jgi:hypothetical protein